MASNMQPLTRLASRSPDPRLPSDYLRRIVDWRARGRGNEPFDYLFFYDHPVHRVPWFIAFNSISVDFNDKGHFKPGYSGNLHYFRRDSSINLQLRVLNETDDLIPPSMQYLGDWIRTFLTKIGPKPMNGALVYNFRDGYCEEIELLQLYPLAETIGASANFDYNYYDGKMRGRAESMRPLFDVTFICSGIGNYTTRATATNPGDFSPPAVRLGEQRKLTGPEGE